MIKYLSKPFNNRILSQIIELDQNVMEYSWSLSVWENFLNNDDYILLYKIEDNFVLSFSLLLCNEFDFSAHLLKIATRPENKKQGHAQAILVQAIDALSLKAYESVFLEVEESNFCAIRLYEKLGFKKLNLIRRFYSNGKDAYAMQLSFNS